jgi:hypothetical protein
VTPGLIQVALQVADALEACGVLYLVGGSVASSIAGEPRTTLDVDMVVAMAETDVDRFLAALGTEFYADDQAIRRGIRQHSSVNLIHQPSARRRRRGSSPTCLITRTMWPGVCDSQRHVRQPAENSATPRLSTRRSFG